MSQSTANLDVLTAIFDDDNLLDNYYDIFSLHHLEMNAQVDKHPKSHSFTLEDFRLPQNQIPKQGMTDLRQATHVKNGHIMNALPNP
jgi:hypothetical protein